MRLCDRYSLKYSDTVRLILCGPTFRTIDGDVSDVKRHNAVKAESQLQNTRNSATDLFNLSGVHKGCDNGNKVWNYEVDYVQGGTWMTVDQWFPTMLTSGESPYC